MDTGRRRSCTRRSGAAVCGRPGPSSSSRTPTSACSCGSRRAPAARCPPRRPDRVEPADPPGARDREPGPPRLGVRRPRVGRGQPVAAPARATGTPCGCRGSAAATIGWYVNLQQPLRRTPLGFEAMDMMLDVVVEPDLTWRWKDEDEFADLLDRGLVDAATGDRVRREGEAVIGRVERRDRRRSPSRGPAGAPTRPGPPRAAGRLGRRPGVATRRRAVRWRSGGRRACPLNGEFHAGPGAARRRRRRDARRRAGERRGDRRDRPPAAGAPGRRRARRPARAR